MYLVLLYCDFSTKVSASDILSHFDKLTSCSPSLYHNKLTQIDKILDYPQTSLKAPSLSKHHQCQDDEIAIEAYFM